MDLKSTKSTSDISETSSLSAKLKRLKIEESLLLQSINKCVSETSYTETVNNASSYLTFSEFKAFSAETKNAFREIMLLFKDIKVTTSSEEMLKSVDIDDIKKSTLKLENRIKTFKSYLQSELAGLKSTEKTLIQTMNDNPVCINNLKRQPRIQTAKYNEIVPSPVKTIMTSPFKCMEVQQFQEFMMNSTNRYGGWNEYYHNIFVNHWQKLFGSHIDDPCDGNQSAVENSPVFQLFLDNLSPKLRDIREEEIVSHVRWYSKYIYLKERQQKAIDKWRNNRKVMKLAKVDLEEKRNKSRSNIRKVPDELQIRNDSDTHATNHSDVRSFIRECFRKNTNDKEEVFFCKNLKQDHHQSSIIRDDDKSSEQPSLNFQKPTVQWNNKIKSRNVDTSAVNLEDIPKVGIPMWRMGLQYIQRQS